jgi:hypothetical protein
MTSKIARVLTAVNLCEVAIISENGSAITGLKMRFNNFLLPALVDFFFK